MTGRIPTGLSRRQLLVSASVGGLSALAGCSGKVSPTDDPETITGTVEGDEPSTDGPLRVTEQQFVAEESPRNRSGLEVRVENAGSERLGAVMLSPQFFDRNDDLLTIGRREVRDLDAGETWRAFVPFYANGRTVKRYEILAEYAPLGGRRPPSSVALVSDKLVDAGYTARVRGDLRNDGNRLSYVEARVKFYDADGDLVYRGRDGFTDLGAGETRSFEVDFEGGDYDLHEEVASHDVELSERWWWR